MNRYENEPNVEMPFIATCMSCSKLYWLDEGNTGIPRKVASMNMDGTNPQILVRNDLQQLGRIAIDIPNQVLYWTQPSGQKVMLFLVFIDIGNLR